jgi:Nickel responsive protein SCO4226-like
VKKYVIERNIPKVGSLEREQLKAASAKSNEALREVGPGTQWQESYVADDKTFCVYLAENESLIHKHAELSGFPASKITEVKTIIDPTTGGISTIL